MAALNAAYEVLRDSRAEYDRSLAAASASASATEDEAAGIVYEEPEAWGSEETDWADVVPGPRHLAHEEPPPVVASDEDEFEFTGRGVCIGIAVLVFAVTVFLLLQEFGQNSLTAPHIRLVPLIAIAAGVIQLFKVSIGWKLTAVLALGGIFTGILSLTGTLTLGPVSGVSLLVLPLAVWFIRFSWSRRSRG
jgi:hypothetical protein